MRTWIKYICDSVFNHYYHSTKVGYIRCGLTEGGEADTPGLTDSPGWPFGSQAQFVSYYKLMMTNIGTTAVANGIMCMGNLNSFDLPEGQISIAQSCGIGTNGYQVNDVVAIEPPNNNCLTITAIQSDWCWNFSQNHAPMPNDPGGRYPILESQTSGSIDSGNDTAGSTGSLSVDGSFPGLIPVANSNNANDGEWYLCDIALAYDSSYTHDCTPHYTGYTTLYQNAFASFAP